MARLIPCLLLLVLVSACGRRRAKEADPPRFERLEVPAAHTVGVVDDYHGTKVADPYRWMEEDGADLQAWIEAQNTRTRAFLDAGSARERIRRRYEKLVNFERFGVPTKEGGLYFWERNDGLQDHSVLYVGDSPDGEGRVLLDPNGWSEDKTVSLAEYWPSPDGKLLAYGLSRGGLDWREFKVLDVESGQDLVADHLKWIKFSDALWSANSRGFFYLRLPEPEEGKEKSGLSTAYRVYYHRIGTPQESDTLVYERPDKPEWRLYPFITDDRRWLGVWVQQLGTINNGIFFKDLETDGPFVEVLKTFDARYIPFGNDGSTFFFLTDLDAPNMRIVAIDLARPEREAWREIVPEDDRYAIRDASLIGGRIVLHYLKRAHSTLEVYGLDGSFQGEVPLPGLGTVAGIRGKANDPEMLFAFTTFFSPGTPHACDLASGKLRAIRTPEVNFDPAKFEAKQIVYRSRDGTRVTMFLTHRKGLQLDGSNPCFLYGYGGFNAAETPFYSTARIVWMEMGGVWAMPNLRGGGEYGRAWHEGGMREKKQNVFDDFIAAAEGLIHNGYTRSDKLAIQGGSNGGLLVGACMTQRPELFGACLPEVGVMDMLRFHKFTVGQSWVAEYGSSDDPRMFPVLLAYSPYHNIRDGVSYPPTMVMTADHDDRVVPAHSYKFAARLQAAQGGDAPILIRVETKAGHGAGRPISMVIDEVADTYAFLARALRIDVPRRLR